MISLLILMTFCLDDILIFLGEIGCWSLVGLEALQWSPCDFFMKSTWVYRIKFHSEEQLVRRLQRCKEINQKMVLKKSFWTSTVEPRFNEGPRDWKNKFTKTSFIISRFFSIHFTITGAENIVRYIKDFINVYNGSLY